MADDSVNINVEGYGSFSIAFPSNFNKETFGDGIQEAVAQTMQLCEPRKPSEQFHPALGMGGLGVHKHFLRLNKVEDTMDHIGLLKVYKFECKCGMRYYVVKPVFQALLLGKTDWTPNWS